MTSTHRLLSIAVATALMAPVAIQAQEEATITVAQAQTVLAGMVKGETRGNLLEGAIVKVKGTNRQVTTDREGAFTIKGLIPGSYTLEVSYVGYDDKSVQVSIAEGRQEIEIALGATMDDLGSMKVQSIRDTQTETLSRQKAAMNIKNFVSADSIGRFPDPNAAEALQRVPGVTMQRDQGEGRYINIRGASKEYTTIALDGVTLPSPDAETRAIDLDTIPTDIISSIEVSKAITPDIDADSIGGQVNIVTQGAFDSDKTIIRATGGYGQNTLGGGSNYRLAATAGDTFNDKFGVLVSATHTSTDRETDNIETSWDKVDNDDGDEFVGPEEIAIKDYSQVLRERTALTARFDYRMTDSDRFHLTATHSKFKDDEYRNSTEFEADGFASGSNETKGTYNDIELVRELRHREVENTINTYAFGGEHEFGSTFLDYTLSTSTSKQEYPNRQYLQYETTMSNVTYDYSDKEYPVFNGSSSGLKADDYEFKAYEMEEQESEDKEDALAVNLETPYMLGDYFATAKFGLKVRSRNKKNEKLEG